MNEASRFWLNPQATNPLRLTQPKSKHSIQLQLQLQLQAKNVTAFENP